MKTLACIALAITMFTTGIVAFPEETGRSFQTREEKRCEYFINNVEFTSRRTDIPGEVKCMNVVFD